MILYYHQIYFVLDGEAVGESEVYERGNLNRLSIVYWSCDTDGEDLQYVPQHGVEKELFERDVQRFIQKNGMRILTGKWDVII